MWIQISSHIESASTFLSAFPRSVIDDSLAVWFAQLTGPDVSEQMIRWLIVALIALIVMGLFAIRWLWRR